MHEGKGGEHYKKHGTIETCIKMEDKAISEISKAGYDVPDEVVCRALWHAMEEKHLDRAGKKKGNSIEAEMAKAKNYHHRAKYGKWEEKE